MTNAMLVFDSAILSVIISFIVVAGLLEYTQWDFLEVFAIGLFTLISVFVACMMILVKLFKR